MTAPETKIVFHKGASSVYRLGWVAALLFGFFSPFARYSPLDRHPRVDAWHLVSAMFSDNWQRLFGNTLGRVIWVVVLVAMVVILSWAARQLSQLTDGRQTSWKRCVIFSLLNLLWLWLLVTSMDVLLSAFLSVEMGLILIRPQWPVLLFALIGGVMFLLRVQQPPRVDQKPKAYWRWAVQLFTLLGLFALLLMPLHTEPPWALVHASLKDDQGDDQVIHQTQKIEPSIESPEPDWNKLYPLDRFSLTRLCEDAGLAYPPPNVNLKIFKRARRLQLYSGDTLVKTYLVGLGNQPPLDKEIEGDHRTPEGQFFVCTRNPQSQYTRFMGLGYPNREDAQRGLDEGLINQATARAIREADAAKRQPPWNTALGGQVGIHGMGSHSDWTWGCIALDDLDMMELWFTCKMKTPVSIVWEADVESEPEQLPAND